MTKFCAFIKKLQMLIILNSIQSDKYTISSCWRRYDNILGDEFDGKFTFRLAILLEKL